jgi:hypothetical protein
MVLRKAQNHMNNTLLSCFELLFDALFYNFYIETKLSALIAILCVHSLQR